jgi:hypothetical protein
MQAELMYVCTWNFLFQSGFLGNKGLQNSQVCVCVLTLFRDTRKNFDLLVSRVSQSV